MTDPADEAMRVVERQAFVRALGYEFAHPDLLELALRHRSWCAEHEGLESNERLEFLGDSVLGLVVTDYLYRFTDAVPEGELARRRSELVNSRTLAEVAEPLGLGAALLLGKGEELTGGRAKQSLLADGFEAVLGAMFLDSGLDPVRSVVISLLQGQLASVMTGQYGTDYKSRLQEELARRQFDGPEYHITESGPDHAKQFDASVTVAGESIGSGVGRSKKQAEQAAAQDALELLDQAADLTALKREDHA